MQAHPTSPTSSAHHNESSPRPTKHPIRTNATASSLTTCPSFPARLPGSDREPSSPYTDTRRTRLNDSHLHFSTRPGPQDSRGLVPIAHSHPILGGDGPSSSTRDLPEKAEQGLGTLTATRKPAGPPAIRTPVEFCRTRTPSYPFRGPPVRGDSYTRFGTNCFICLDTSYSPALPSARDRHEILASSQHTRANQPYPMRAFSIRALPAFHKKTIVLPAVAAPTNHRERQGPWSKPTDARVHGLEGFLR